jgi:dihydrofolate reductase
MRFAGAYFDDEAENDAVEILRRTGTAVFGRVTYQAFEGAWATTRGAFADAVNAAPKVVVSSSLIDPSWTNTTLIDGDVIEQIGQMRDAGRGLVVYGAGQLSRSLLQAGLVDEVRYIVHPVIVGNQGVPQAESFGPASLDLRQSRARRSGVMVLDYSVKPPSDALR